MMKKTKPQNTKAPSKSHNAHAHDGFSYSRNFFEGLVDSALKHAKKIGATDAGAEASEGCGLSVSVRKGELETVERNRDKSLGVTVYVGHRRGNASTSDFSEAAIQQTVQAAFDIARFTAEDPTAGLPDQDDIAKVLACLRSRAISLARTRMDFGVVMPVHVTACQWRPLHHCQAKMQKCNAMLGTPPCAQPIKWPRLKQWVVTPPSAR